jgi:hypothetical protein
MQLSRLVYYSTYALKSSGNALVADLQLILASAIRNNRDHDVTGGLVFNRSHFVQVLEGDSVSVSQTFARISRDPRHCETVLVEMKPVSARLFGAWSMGYAGKTQLFDSLCKRFGVSGKFDPATMAGDDLVTFVLELVSAEEKLSSSKTNAAA